ncbi:MAG: 1-acyl-sn-glycerol-3-phosphate acyltransferase [Actinobacteria bacterium]|nr:1-acyl-sn-glycerol-3-phosphate acyltransferase [Actinomycetota bacterium]
MEPVYTPVIGTCLAAFKVLNWDVRVTGEEHIPADGPGVVATNHVGYLDFIFAGFGVREQSKRRLRFLAKKEIWDNPVAGPMMRSMKHIPVDRGGRASQSLDAAIEALRSGELVGMFPESTISRSFMPLRGKTGAARMALATGAPLIPGAVWGTQRLWTKGRPRDFRRNVPITVSFGPSIDYAPDEDPQAVTDRLMAAIGELVARAQEEYPDTPATPDDGWWLPAHLGGTAPTPEAAAELAAQEAAARRERRQREVAGES